MERRKDDQRGRPAYPWDAWAQRLGFGNEREMLTALRAWGWGIDRIAATLKCGVGKFMVPTRTAVWSRLRLHKIPTTDAARCNPGGAELRRQARLIARGGK